MATRRNAALVFLVLTAAVAVLHVAEGASYVVGDSTGWNVPSATTFYSSWASNLNFSVGDTLGELRSLYTQKNYPILAGFSLHTHTLSLSLFVEIHICMENKMNFPIYSVSVFLQSLTSQQEHTTLRQLTRMLLTTAPRAILSPFKPLVQQI